MNPSTHARIAVHESWAQTTDRTARTEPGRRAAADRFMRMARERFGDLPEDELQQRAEHLKKAHFARMGAKSGESRRQKAGQS